MDQCVSVQEHVSFYVNAKRNPHATFEIRLEMFKASAVASATESDDRDNRFRSIQVGPTVVKEPLAQYPTEICLKMHHDNDNKTGQQQHQALEFECKNYTA